MNQTKIFFKKLAGTATVSLGLNVKKKKRWKQFSGKKSAFLLCYIPANVLGKFSHLGGTFNAWRQKTALMTSFNPWLAYKQGLDSHQ